MKPKPQQEEEEETTIEEVIEELRNIINDAETEAFNKKEREDEEERKRMEEAQVASKLQTRVDVDDYAISNEIEIIPSNLHPQPPRKARSLIHLFIPAEDYDYCNKEMFFENETAFTSEEGSDSLLSASKCQLPAAEKGPGQENGSKARKCRRNTSRTSVKRAESFRRTTPVKNDLFYTATKERQRAVDVSPSHRMKCKSLDRIDGGLDTLVDIIVTSEPEEKTAQSRTKSDSGNATGTSLCRSISNVVVSPKRESRSRLSTHSEEKQKMFLPQQRDHAEIPYYFPRIQEKRNGPGTSFLIKRGHTNAGLYSGQVLADDHQVMVLKSKEFSSSSRLCGKVTDLPSGLY